jgi:hypothetical protein
MVAVGGPGERGVLDTEDFGVLSRTFENGYRDRGPKLAGEEEAGLRAEFCGRDVARRAADSCAFTATAFPALNKIECAAKLPVFAVS